MSISRGAIEYLATRGHDVDVVVLGSSTVQLHFVTERFNKAMKERGHPVRAFAFASKGMLGGELDYFLEQILALNLPKLRWVLMDVTLKQLRPLDRENWYKRRVIEWHAPKQVLDLQRLIWQTKQGPIAKVEQWAPHVAHGLLRLANVGDGIDAAADRSLFRMGKPERLRPPSAFSVGAYVEKRQAKAKARYRATRRQAHFSAVSKLRKAREQPESKVRGGLRENEYAVLFRDRVEASGAKAAFILAPALNDVRMRADVPGAAPLRFLDFNDPARYPELYDIDNRYDPLHLAWSGALLFTDRLADRFAELLDAEAALAP